MPESINSKLKEQYDHDDSGGSLDTNLGDFLDSEGASGTSNNSKWRDWASGTGTSLNTRLFHKHGGSGSFMTRWKNWIAFSSTHSFNFDGSNDYLDLGNHSAFDVGTGDFSVSAWINVTLGSGENQKSILYSRDASSPNAGFDFQVDDGADRLRAVFDEGATVLEARGVNNSLSSDTWHHVVMAVNRTSGTCKLYLDGSLNKSVDISSLTGSFSNSGSTFIGAKSSTQQRFDGLIDELAMWHIELSASDVTSIYNNGKVIDLSKSASYGTDRTDNLKLWLRAGDKAEPESTTAIARQDFYTDFDGSNDYVAIGSAIGDMSGKDVSVTVWFNSRNISDQKGIISQQDGTGTGRFLLYNESNKLKSFLGGAEHSVSTNLQANKWHHACYTMNSSTNEYKLYLDGQLGDSGTDAIESADGDFFIGTSKTLGSAVFDGAISNLALYNTTLDAQTISQMAKSRFTPMRDNRFSVVDFDGSNDHIVLSSSALYSTHTFSIWVNPTDNTSANVNTILLQKNDSNNFVQIWHTGTGNTFGKNHIMYRVKANGVTSNNQYNTEEYADEWIHIVGVSSSSGTKLYINGVEKVSNSTDVTNIQSGTVNEYFIGDDANTLLGSISSVAVYNTAKSAEEVYAIYQQGITYDESSLSGLQGYWRMGDDTSKAYPTIADSSSNSNDGTITNGASDDIVQQMVAGYDLGSFESSSEELSAEKINNGDFSAWTADNPDGWIISGESGSNVITENANGARIVSDGTNVNMYQSVMTIGKTYVVTIVVHTVTTGDIATQGLSSNFTISSAGTHTNTVTATSTSLLIKRNTACDIVVSSVSVKEVLQSEVSDTYPLLVDVNNPVISQDLQTGTWNNSDLVGFTGASADGFTAVNTDSGQGNNDNAYGDEISFEAGKTYKLSFTNTVNSGTIPSLFVGVTSGTTGSADNIMSYSTFSATNDYSYTFTPSSTVTRRPSFRFVANGTYDFTISNFELIEYNGNTGVMTNQATSDLVYSSVLPDQSFLTGVNSAYNFFNFDGTNEYIEGSDTIPAFGTNPFSVSVWVNPTSTNQDGLFANANNATGDYFFLSISATNFVGTGTSTAWKHRFDSSDTQLNTWQLLTYVREGTGTNQSKWYINGELKDTSTDTTNWLTGTGWHIGAYGDSIGHFPGSIGQLAIWNDALTASEVSAIYTLGRHGNLLDSYSDNLKGYWAMSALDAKTGLSDVGDGTIYDRSGNSNHGTATNTESADLKSSPNAEPNGYAKGDTNRSTTTP